MLVDGFTYLRRLLCEMFKRIVAYAERAVVTEYVNHVYSVCNPPAFLFRMYLTDESNIFNAPNLSTGLLQ